MVLFQLAAAAPARFVPRFATEKAPPSDGRPGGRGSRTFFEFVLKENVYYHPFGWGGGWPTLPPNFFAFRWAGHVRRIQRVMDHEVIPDLQSRWPDIPEDAGTTRPHIVDQLLTCDSLADALSASEVIRNR